jgi:hypothetical protein
VADTIGMKAVLETAEFMTGLSAINRGLESVGRMANEVVVGALRRVGELAVDALVAAGRAAARYSADILQAAVDTSPLGDTLDRIKPSLVDITRVSFAPLFEQLDGMVQRAAPAFLGLVGAAETYLGGLAQSALSWGEGTIDSFAQGMWNAIGSVLDVLSSIGNAISYWLAPGSPPNLLPELDKWGTDAINEWLSGWGKGDFGVFNDLSSTLTSLIRSLPVPAGDQVGVIPRILGTREAIAQAVEEMRTAGAVSASTMDAIVAQVGTADASVRAYLESMIKLEASNQAVSDAQAALNQATDAYAELLKPIDDQLASISEEQTQFDEDQKKAMLAKVLADPGALPAEKRRAALELERIDAERARRAAVLQGKATVDAAQTQLDAAKDAQAVAQDDFSARKAAITLMAEQNALLKEQLALLERLNKEAAGGGGPKPAGGKPGPAPGFKPGGFDLGDLIPDSIKEKLAALQTAFEVAWSGILAALQPAIDAWQNQVVPAWNHLVSAITDSMPDIESAIGEMVAFVATELGVVLTGVFANVAISLDTLAHIWENHHSTMLSVVVNTFKIIFTTVSVTLLLISGLVAVVLNQISGFLDAWSLLFTDGWQAAWDQVKLTFYDSGQIILDTLAVALDAILLIVGQDTDSFIAIWEGVWNNAHVIVMHYIDLIREAIKEWTGSIGTTVREDMGKVETFWTGVWQLIARALDEPILAVDNIFRAVEGLYNWLLTHVFDFHINWPTIPEDWQHNSPTPVEMGVRGVSDALKELRSISLPNFLGASSINTISNSSSNAVHYHLTVNSAMQSQGVISDYRIMEAMAPV